MEEEERDIGLVWQDIFCALEEEGAVRDIDIVLFAVVRNSRVVLKIFRW